MWVTMRLNDRGAESHVWVMSVTGKQGVGSEKVTG